MNPKVLVIDDEPDALELVRLNLSNAGYTVLASSDGAIVGLVTTTDILRYVERLG